MNTNKTKNKNHDDMESIDLGKRIQICEEIIKKQNSDTYKREIEESQEYLLIPQNDFVCRICFDFIVKTITTLCGHSFCERCLYEYLIFFLKCPTCPMKLR